MYTAIHNSLTRHKAVSPIRERLILSVVFLLASAISIFTPAYLHETKGVNLEIESRLEKLDDSIVFLTATPVPTTADYLKKESIQPVLHISSTITSTETGQPTIILPPNEVQSTIVVSDMYSSTISLDII